MMVQSRNGHEQPLDLILDIGKVDEDKEICYWGNKITKDVRRKRNIRCRIALAIKAWLKKDNF